MGTRRGDNNPRVFAETVSLDAWRTPFDGERGEADLHVNVVFAKGRLGGGDAPVRFRLSLRGAEVHVIRDSAEVIRINPSSVLQPEAPVGKAQRTEERKTHVQGGVSAGVSPKSVDLSASGKAGAEMTVTDRLEQSSEVSAMKFKAMKTELGYVFRIEPRAEKRLDGQPWVATTPVMKLRDSKAGRTRGEPPEVRIEIHCLREDLVIEDVEFTDGRFPTWGGLGRNKQIAVEQYLKDELTRAGLPCGDLSDAFARIVLGDASPVCEP